MEERKPSRIGDRLQEQQAEAREREHWQATQGAAQKRPSSLKSPSRHHCSSQCSPQTLFLPFSSSRRSTYLVCGVPAALRSRPAGRRSRMDPSAAHGPPEPGERRLLPQQDVSLAGRPTAGLCPKGRDQTLP